MLVYFETNCQEIEFCFKKFILLLLATENKEKKNELYVLSFSSSVMHFFELSSNIYL